MSSHGSRESGRPLITITGPEGGKRQPAGKGFRDIFPLPVPPPHERDSRLRGHARRRDRHRYLKAESVRGAVRALNWMHNPVGQPCSSCSNPMHADILHRVDGLVSVQELIPVHVTDTRGALKEFLGGRSDYEGRATAVSLASYIQSFFSWPASSWDFPQAVGVIGLDA